MPSLRSNLWHRCVLASTQVTEVMLDIWHLSPMLPAMTMFLSCYRWLKFLIIWRFFRLATLAAGLDAPENMRRCFANNYDIEVQQCLSHL